MEATAQYDWPAIIDEVCRWLSSGRTIRDYCRQEGKPGHVQLYEKLGELDEAGTERIVRARARGCDAIADEVLAIADDSSEDTITTEDGDEKPDTEWIQRSKLRVEARMRLMSKWNSGRYGDRQQVEHSGGVSLNVVTGVPEPKAE